MKVRRPVPEPFEGRLYDRPMPGLENLQKVVAHIPVTDEMEGWGPNRSQRGRRAPAIAVPVDAPPKSKRGRRA